MTHQPAIEPERPLSYGALLLWGGVTLWIYTALRLGRLLRAHGDRRSAELAVAGAPAAGPDPLAALGTYARAHAVVVPLLVALPLAAGEAYYELNGTVGPGVWLSLLASVAFACSALAFLVQLFRRLQLHESLEQRALAARGFAPATAAGEARPADWNRHESWLTLVALVSVACIATPTVAVYQLASLPSLTEAAVMEASRFWVVVVLVAGGVFHALGTAFIERLVNGHFGWERRLAPSPAAPAETVARVEPEARSVGLRAVMFTDIKGYSRRMEDDEAAALRILDIHNAIVRQAIARHAGREIKTVGDAFLVVFDSAVQAVQCGVALQQALHAHNRTAAPGDEILVRAGIHLGDVVLAGGDVFGDSVNLAARLESVAEPGGICISGEVHQVVSRRLKLPFQSLGRVPLKNIATPPEVFAITRASIDPGAVEGRA